MGVIETTAEETYDKSRITVVRRALHSTSLVLSTRLIPWEILRRCECERVSRSATRRNANRDSFGAMLSRSHRVAEDDDHGPNAVSGKRRMHRALYLTADEAMCFLGASSCRNRSSRHRGRQWCLVGSESDICWCRSQLKAVDSVRAAIQAYTISSLPNRQKSLDLMDQLVADAEPGQRAYDELTALKPLAIGQRVLQVLDGLRDGCSIATERLCLVPLSKEC